MDDQTQRIEPVPPDAGAAAAETPAAPATEWQSASPAAPTTPVVATSGPNRMRWFLGTGVAGIAIAAGLAVVLVLGAPASPEALKYIPGDAAFVAELRMDLPGDQMQALGNLLAHFPGFQDQATLPEKIDEALSRIVEQVPGSSTDYKTDVKPLLAGPTFVGIQSFADMQTSRDPKNMIVVATTNGSASCGTTFEGQTLTTETYNGIQLSLAGDGKVACAVDGRFFLVGDPAGVKGAIDVHKSGTGLDKSARYAAARSGLGLDRLATLYIDGAAIGKAMPAPLPSSPLNDLASALPEWVIAGLRAESDALLFDVVYGPVSNPAPIASLRTPPPVHPLALTAMAPSDTLLFLEAQGATVGIHNALLQLQGDPTMAEALKQLDTMGGVDGLIDWIDDVGFVVVRQGDLPAGAILLVAKDAAAATQKVTTIETVLSLGAMGSDIEVSTATVEGVKVTTVHIPDISALAGTAVPGGAAGIPPVAIDFAIAAKDRVVIVGIGEGIVPKILGVKAGASLADDAAFKRAITRSLPNPQSLLYVAAGASLEWLESVAVPQGAPAIPADVKAYLDPLEGIVFSATGDGTRGSARFAFTVANP